MAWRSGDPAAARETLALNDVSDPHAASYAALALAQLGFAADAERLLARLPERFEPPDIGAWTEWEGPVYQGNLTMTRGTLAVLDGRFEEAIPLLEEGLPLMGSRGGLSDYFRGAMTLATALERLDRPEQAIEILEETSRSKVRVLRRKHYWLMLRLRLAQTLRRYGRDVEAAEVEEELSRYLAHADDDFPLLVELRLQQDLRDVEVERRN
jgi:tetratricopeptide (TPR) repeat protein